MLFFWKTCWYLVNLWSRLNWIWALMSKIFIMQTHFCLGMSLSHIWLFVTPWTVACQAHLVHGILQVTMLKSVAVPFSRVSSQPRVWTQVSRIAGRFFTSWATTENPKILEWVAYPFSRDLPDPEIELAFPASQAYSLPAGLSGKPFFIYIKANKDITFIT